MPCSTTLLGTMSNRESVLPTLMTARTGYYFADMRRNRAHTAPRPQSKKLNIVNLNTPRVHHIFGQNTMAINLGTRRAENNAM